MAKSDLNVSSKLLISLLCLLYSTREIHSLYEDQVGKFDWKKPLIGKVKYADFEGNRLLVATEENVLACLNAKNGELLWRQVLENSDEQQVQFFELQKELYTVSGGKNSWYVRGWEITSGTLLWEWTINSEKVLPTSYFSISNRELIHVIPTENSHIEYTSYSIDSGNIQTKTTKLSTPWLSDAFKCVNSKKYFVCIVKNEIKYINLLSDSPTTSTKNIQPNVGEADILTFPHETPSVLIVQNNVAKIVQLKNDAEIIPATFMPNVISTKNGLYQLEININNPEKLLKIISQDSNGNHQQSIDVEYPKGLGAPYILAAQCRSSCDLLISTTDHALLLVKSDGKIAWTREEALADIVAVEFFELPVSELDASIVNEFKTSSQNILSMFLHRITSQTKQLSNLFFGSQLLMNNMLVRDDFGLHKIIVVVTRVGKLFAIDTLSGHTVWSYRLPHVVPFTKNGDAILYIQRTARHAPLPAQCTLLATDDTTGNTVMFQFDPITGLSSRGIIKLNGKIKQSMLLPYEDENHLKPFILVNMDDTVDVYPKEARNIVEKHLSSIYFYMVAEDVINGYALKSKDGQIKTSLHWNFIFKPSKLVCVSTRPNGERVHSQGRVLPDRSVYYKYVNPNMIAVATISDDPIHKQVLSVYLIDGITGFVVFGLSHKRARGPVSLVHSENWLVYTFFNEKYRRTELAAVELYEGYMQSNSTVFSSYAVGQLPILQSQSYILPAAPSKLAVTQTERGITNKCLIVALNTGAVVEIPWALVQPRFENIPCGPEESCYPYMPEIPIHSEASINYNQTLLKVKGIAVAPARLESTSHILVHGLDIFYTRVAPSKTFDVLKDDFDHNLIIIVLIALILASYVSKSWATKKVMKQSWK